MPNNELLIAISDMMDTKLRPVNEQLERMEQRLKKIEFAQENIILPRLQNIEACYTSTYERYRDGVDQIVSMQSDIDVIITTITRHSEILQKFA